MTGNDPQRDDKGRPRPSSAVGKLLDQAIARYEAARAAGQWWLALKHQAIKRELERLIFGAGNDK